MNWSLAGLALATSSLLFIINEQDQKIKILNQRVAALEKRTAPIDKLCGEDDYYEAFFRLMQEVCEKR